MSGPGSDTIAMLQTLDFNGSVRTDGQAAVAEVRETTERESALHTMLLHSNQEASAEFLLQGGAMDTLLTVATHKDPSASGKEALLSLKALTNLAALPMARQHLLKDEVVGTILEVGKWHKEQRFSDEERLQALRCITNLATCAEAKICFASCPLVDSLVDIVSKRSSGEGGTEEVASASNPANMQWRIAALKIMTHLSSDEDFRSEMLRRNIEDELVGCFLEEQTSVELKIEALQVYRTIILSRDKNQPLSNAALGALFQLLRDSRTSWKDIADGVVEYVLSTILILSRQFSPSKQLLESPLLNELASMGISDKKGAATRDRHCMDILMGLSALDDAEAKFLQAGVIDMLLAFLVSAQDENGVSPSMVFAVSIVMNTCAGDDPIKEALLEKGVVDTLASILNNPAADSEGWAPFCLQTTKALMNLSVGKGISPLITATVRIRDVARLASSAFSVDQRLCALRLLSNLCAEDLPARDAATSPEIVEALLEAAYMPAAEGAGESDALCGLEAMRVLVVLALTESCRNGLIAARTPERVSEWLVAVGGRTGAEATETGVMVLSLLLSDRRAARQLVMALDSDVGLAAMSSGTLMGRLEALADSGGGSVASLARETVGRIRAAREMSPEDVAEDEEAGAPMPAGHRDGPAPPVQVVERAEERAEERQQGAAGEEDKGTANNTAQGGAKAREEGVARAGADVEEAGAAGGAREGGGATTMAVGIPMARDIPFDEIVNRTEGFAPPHQIGRGRGWGAYAVMELEHMPACAVKPLGWPEIGLEVEKLVEQAGEVGPCRHESLLPLLGTAMQEGEHEDKIGCLLTPIAPGGSLALRLFPLPQSEIPQCLPAAAQGGRLAWADTLRVLVQAGRGLAYLHAPDPQIGKPGFLHGSVNPSNILLDEHLNGRLADGFLGRFNGPEATMHVSRQPMGFLDPAFARSGIYDATTDGYGLGMTMLVALTGHAAMDSEWAEPDLVDRCDDALYGGDVARCLALADSQAGWPEKVVMCLVEVIAGLLHRRKAARISVAEACRRMQELMAAMGLSWGLRLPEGARVCGFCTGLSNVRFGCGHAVCCTNCIGADPSDPGRCQRARYGAPLKLERVLTASMCRRLASWQHAACLPCLHSACQDDWRHPESGRVSKARRVRDKVASGPDCGPRGCGRRPMSRRLD